MFCLFVAEIVTHNTVPQHKRRAGCTGGVFCTSLDWETRARERLNWLKGVNGEQKREKRGVVEAWLFACMRALTRAHLPPTGACLQCYATVSPLALLSLKDMHREREIKNVKQNQKTRKASSMEKINSQRTAGPTDTMFTPSLFPRSMTAERKEEEKDRAGAREQRIAGSTDATFCSFSGVIGEPRWLLSDTDCHRFPTWRFLPFHAVLSPCQPCPHADRVDRPR